MLNSKIKLLILVAVSSFMIFFTNIVTVGIIAIISVILVFITGTKSKFFAWIKPLSLGFVMILLFHTFYFSGIGFSYIGLYSGLLYALRVVSLIILVFLFSGTTSLERMANAFAFLPESVQMVLVLALSLLPKTMELATNIINAQKSRGLNFKAFNISRTYFPILVPLFAQSLKRSEYMSLAMSARGLEK